MNARTQITDLAAQLASDGPRYALPVAALIQTYLNGMDAGNYAVMSAALSELTRNPGEYARNLQLIACVLDETVYAPDSMFYTSEESKRHNLADVVAFLSSEIKFGRQLMADSEGYAEAAEAHGWLHASLGRR